MKVVLTSKRGAESVKRSNQKPGQAVSTNSVHLYLPQEFYAKLNEVAVLNKRSLSSVAAEMVEFALNTLIEGDTELEPEREGVQPVQEKPKVTLRMTLAPKREPTDDEIAAETLKRIVPELDYDKSASEAHRRNANAMNGYGLIRE